MTDTSADDAPLYVAQKKVYPQSIQGRFRRIKWALLAFGMAIYYFLPFIRWDRGPNLPDQAVLIDMPGRRFYFFFIEIWPQEVYYFTGLLIMAAMALFLMNALAGRIWCGYLCPQTVWTDLFFAVERLIEGDRRERMKKDKEPFTVRRAGELVMKHFIWLMIAWWTGGAWVLYFADAPTLVKELATGEAPMVAYIWIGILTATTYALAGFMREQVCVYMCPWPRIQAALTDEWALNVTYRYDRGEPRMSTKQAIKARAAGEPAGDCVDCNQCVAVCPTGIDIRNGPQLQCIQCSLCIDACDAVMDKIGRPRGLVAYDNDINIHHREKHEPEQYRPIRARTIIYTTIIVAIAALMAVTMFNRRTADVSVLHDRNPLYVANSDGSIRNAFTVRFLNKKSTAREFVLSVTGVSPVRIEAVGITKQQDGNPVVEVAPDTTREVRVSVTVPRGVQLPKSSDIQFGIQEVGGSDKASARDHFLAP